MLIITGITIAILVGNSGIIEQAREAKNNTQKALENENEILEKFISKINKITSEKQYRAHFFNIVNLYSGMDRILADKTYGNSLKNMNSKYFNAFFERRNNKTK